MRACRCGGGERFCGFRPCGVLRTCACCCMRIPGGRDLPAGGECFPKTSLPYGGGRVRPAPGTSRADRVLPPPELRSGAHEGAGQSCEYLRCASARTVSAPYRRSPRCFGGFRSGKSAGRDPLDDRCPCDGGGMVRRRYGSVRAVRPGALPARGVDRRGPFACCAGISSRSPCFCRPCGRIPASVRENGRFLARGANVQNLSIESSDKFGSIVESRYFCTV